MRARATMSPRTTTSEAMKPTSSGRLATAALRSMPAPDATKKMGWKKPPPSTRRLRSRSSLPSGKSARRMKPAVKAPSTPSKSKSAESKSSRTRIVATRRTSGNDDPSLFSLMKCQKRVPRLRRRVEKNSASSATRMNTAALTTVAHRGRDESMKLMAKMGSSSPRDP